MSEEKKAKWGERMIKVEIKFFTNDLPKGTKVDERTAWFKGLVKLSKNASRGIKPTKLNFNSKAELLPKLNQLLQDNNINLVKPSKKVEFETIN
jgi:hypothetical protein